MKTAYSDMKSNLTGTASIAHATISSDTTGSAVTLTGGPVLIAVYVSAAGTADATNYFTFLIHQSDDASTYAAADTSQYVTGSSWDRLINATTETGWYFFNFIPEPGYYSIKIIGDETGTASITCSAHVIQGGIHQPVTA